MGWIRVRNAFTRDGGRNYAKNDVRGRDVQSFLRVLDNDPCMDDGAESHDDVLKKKVTTS